jgi:hypothetical protein
MQKRTVAYIIDLMQLICLFLLSYLNLSKQIMKKGVLGPAYKATTIYNAKIRAVNLQF